MDQGLDHKAINKNSYIDINNYFIIIILLYE